MAISDKKIRNADENLGILRIVYGVSFGLGFWQIGQGIAWPWTSISVLPSILVAMMLTLLSVRFYWAVGNIRRYVRTKSKSDATSIGRWVMIVHVPILLLHSFIFYVLSRLYSEMFAPDGSVTGGYDFLPFIVIYIGIISLNGIWIILCLPSKTDDAEIKSERLFWAKNNIIFSGICIAVLAVPFVSGNVETISIFALFTLNSLIDLYFKGEVYIFNTPG